jgi:5-hydroxyisourate hydrolase-like protein (transthyretin family)
MHIHRITSVTVHMSCTNPNPITTHVLDTARGMPAANLSLKIEINRNPGTT